MNRLRRPVVAGLGPGAGTSVLAAALHGVDAGRWTGGPVDVLVCPAGTDLGDLPAVPVVALRGGRGPAARPAGPAVVLPEVAAWRGADATRAAAGLLGLAPHRRPPTQRGYADAVLALTAALVRSGALTAPPPTPAAPAPRHVNTTPPASPPPHVSTALHVSAPPHASTAPHSPTAPHSSTAAAPRAPRTTGPGGRQLLPGCTGPARRPVPAPVARTEAGSAARGGPTPGAHEPGTRTRAPGRVVVADPRRRSTDALPLPEPTRSLESAVPARTSSTTGTAPAGTSTRPTAVPTGASTPDDDTLDHDTLRSGTSLLLDSAHAPGAHPRREIDVRGLRRPSDPTHVDLGRGTDRATSPTGASELARTESSDNDPAVAAPFRSLPLGPPQAPDSRPSREIDVSGLHEPSEPAHVDLVRGAERATSPAGGSELARAESSGGAATAVVPGAEPAIGSAAPPAADPAAISSDSPGAVPATGSPDAEPAPAPVDPAVPLGVEPVAGPAGSAGHLDSTVRPTAAAPVLLHRAEPVRPRLVAGRALRLAGPDTAPAPGAVAPGVPAVPMPSLVRPEAARRVAEAGRRLRIAPVVAVAVRPGVVGPDDDAIEHGAVPAEAGASALRTG